MPNQFFRFSFLLIVLGIGGIQPAWGLQEGIAVDAVSVRSAENTDQTQLDLFVQIPYSNLNFSSGPLGFTARYQVSAEATALDSRGRPTFIVQSGIWDRSVTVPIFAQTESTAQRDLTTHSLLLDPGQYLVGFQITDQNANETTFRELTVGVPNMDQPLTMSSLVILDSYDEETRTIYPRVNSVLGGDILTFDVFVELYTDTPRTVTLTQEIISNSRSLGTVSGAPVFRDETLVEVDSDRHQMVLTFPATGLDVGSYSIRVTLEGDSFLETRQRQIISQWTGLADYLDDLDTAIEQMVYIASPQELRELQAGPTPREKLKRFNEFWAGRDPAPETERNELMEQYFYRVSVANQRYSAVRPGWQTDRGHVLILHGEPEDTHRQTFRFHAEPYEVWYYYRIGRRYVFVDVTGFSDYQLLVPIWDERTRLR